MKKKDLESFLAISGVKLKYVKTAAGMIAEGDSYRGEYRDNREKHLSFLMMNKYFSILKDEAAAEKILNLWNNSAGIDVRIRGDFHVHTVYSDGTGTVEDMVRTAESIGYGWIVLSDHSPADGNPFRLDENRFVRFLDEVSRVRENTGVVVYRAVESDISDDGSIIVPERWRDSLDFVTASFHEKISDYDKVLYRIDAATKDPLVRVFAHPFYGLDHDCSNYIANLLRILKCNGTAVEVNVSPQYLLRNTLLVDAAVKEDVDIVFSTDSHFAESLYLMRFASGFLENINGSSMDRILNFRETAPYNENTF